MLNQYMQARIARMERSQLGTYLLLIAAVLPSAVMAQKNRDVRLNTDQPRAARSAFPQIAASGDSVYVTWEDQRNGSSDIYFNRSLDGGAAWLSSDLRLNTNPIGSNSATRPQIAIFDQKVYVTWEASQDGVTCDVYFNRSLDGGSTWLTSNIRLNRAGPLGACATLPQIEASGNSIYVTWEQQNFFSQRDINFNRSLDGGATWLSSAIPLNKGGDATRPRIAASGDSVYVSWGSLSLSLNLSTDGGATWLASTILVAAHPRASGFTFNHQIAASGNSVYLAWQDTLNGSMGIYFNRSLDGGATWLTSDIRLDTDLPGAARSFTPQIATSGDSVYVTWTDNRNYSSLTWASDIYFNRSLDGGATWLTSDFRLNTDVPEPGLPTWMAASVDPQIAASDESVYVTWWDLRDSPHPFTPLEDIYFNRSLDLGTTWLTSDIRLNTEQSGATHSVGPQIAASDDSVYVTWHDRTNPFLDPGPGDIYFNIPFGAQPYGEGTQGSGDIAPRLEGTDSLNLGSTFTLTVTDGLGGAFGLLGLGGPDSMAAIPAVGGLLLINPIQLVLPILLDGVPGVAGAGTTSIEFPIPVEKALLGFNVNLQAAFLDPGASDGVTLTNGVEAWIL